MRNVLSHMRLTLGGVVLTAVLAVGLVASSFAGAQQPENGTITVEKQTNPDGYQPPQGGFVFSGAIDAVLGDGESASLEVEPGTYGVTENLEGRPFWDLISIECSDDDSSGNLETGTATFEVEAGETVKCTFTNEKRSLLIIRKQTRPAGAAQSFDFTANFDDDGFSLADGEQSFIPLPAGTYSVVENEIEGWVLESATCDNGDDPSSIELPADSSATCTFTNVPSPGGKLTPGVATDVHDANHNVVLSAPVGTTVHDLARVTGSGATPTGTVTFTVYMGSTTCSGEGESAGTVALDGSGVAHPSQSRVVPAGGLSFRAVYSGDSVYNPANGPCEALAAATALTPGVATDVHDANHNVVLSAPVGTTVHDLARVTGSGATPTGTVTFTVYMGSTTCSGEGDSAGTVALDGSGVAHPSQSRAVPAGGLSFRAVYSGDSVYNPANGPCEALAARVVILGQGSIDVQKSASPTTIKEPGGPVAYAVTIKNTSGVLVTITSVVDDRFGNLENVSGGNPGGCFDVPVNLAPGASTSCQFTKTISGSGGTSHVNTVTASGFDQFFNPLSDSGNAKVDITPQLIDLVVVKDASSPTPLNGVVNYSLSVTNKGPDTATNVQLADPAPAGITYLTASPSQGTCNLGAALITCSLGSIAAGQTVTIAITGRATTVGSHTNTATVTGSGGRETNPADNVDSAVTVVPAPLTPPAVKPKPKPAPAVCLTLTVTPKMIKADGEPDRVVAKVRAASKAVKGARVLVKGGGIRKSGRTNGKGVAVITIKPQKPGLITITTIDAQKSCGAKRIGVVGVFLPPLTG